MRDPQDHQVPPVSPELQVYKAPRASTEILVREALLVVLACQAQMELRGPLAPSSCCRSALVEKLTKVQW